MCHYYYHFYYFCVPCTVQCTYEVERTADTHHYCRKYAVRPCLSWNEMNVPHTQDTIFSIWRNVHNIRNSRIRNVHRRGRAHTRTISCDEFNAVCIYRVLFICYSHSALDADIETTNYYNTCSIQLIRALSGMNGWSFSICFFVFFRRSSSTSLS